MSQTIATPMQGSKSVTSVIADGFRYLDTVSLSVPLAMARVAVGAVFWKSGLTKIASWETTVALFREEYRLPILSPEIAALLGTAMELTCPVLLVLGLGTRLGALGLFGMTAVIQMLVYPENWTEHLTWAALLAFLVVRGAGSMSLDGLLGRYLAKAG